MNILYRIHPLVYGHIEEPEPRIFYLGDCAKSIKLVNMFFLLQGNGMTVVVDTGVSKKDCDAFNPYMTQAPEEDPAALLQAHGVRPEDVTHVIATHLHWDHVSPTVMLFKKAHVYVHPAELEAVFNPPYPWFGRFMYTDVLKELKDSGRFIETRDGFSVAPGLSTIWTGGHTFGSQGVIAETSKGRAVLTGDVCFTYRNLEEDTPGGFNSNLLECFDAFAKIRSSGSIIIPSHDPLVSERYAQGV